MGIFKKFKGVKDTSKVKGPAQQQKKADEQKRKIRYPEC